MARAIGRDRAASFGDAVFAVIITIMVLQLKLPAHPTFGALFEEWPTAISYAVSYLLIAIMWINHHFLLRFAKDSTPRLILWTFTHMFAASLVPFATAWMASTRLAPVPVFVYAAAIVFVNLSYHAFAYAVIGPRADPNVSQAMRRKALARSLLTIGLFTVAMIVALKLPIVAFALVTCVLLTYAQPEIPGSSKTLASDSP
ncbi:MAG TPA: TMEM175 family protein [Candidatus Baltobacteraceae bacterium]|nr:TMEM175 family protein [Candidatus Baltobacteraceae bacterium]